MIRVGLYGKRSGGNGLGRFAQAIMDGLSDEPDFDVVITDKNNPNKLDCIVYASRSDSELEEAVKICAEKDIPLYLLSSDMAETLARLKPACKIIKLANSSLEMQEFLDSIRLFYRNHPDYKTQIIEYHQQNKRDVSGTALALVGELGLDKSVITSIRDNQTAQELFEIPNEFMSGYAIHQIIFMNPATLTKQKFEVIILGRQTYVTGLTKILQADFNLSLVPTT